MMAYRDPFLARWANADGKARRYRTDPQWRLKRINRARQQLGLPPRASLDEVKMRVPMESME